MNTIENSASNDCWESWAGLGDVCKYSGPDPNNMGKSSWRYPAIKSWFDFNIERL